MGDVAPGGAAVVPLPKAPLEYVQGAGQAAGPWRRAARHVGAGDLQEAPDVPRLEFQIAVHIGFAKTQTLLEGDPAGPGVGETHHDRLSRAIAIARRASIGVTHLERADHDHAAKDWMQKGMNHGRDSQA